MKIRPITLNNNDIAGLTKLMNQWDDIPSKLSTDYILNFVARINKNENCEIFICEDSNQKIIGYIYITEILFLGEDPLAEIQSILVADKFKKKGIGKKLVEAAEKWAKDKGFKKVILSSRIQLSNAHKFYTKLDYNQFKQAYFFSKKLPED